MAKATLANQANALITLYIKLYTDKYEHAPKLNRYRERWGFQSMVEDLGYEKSQEVIRYYMRQNRPGHPVSHLLFNYDNMAEVIEELEQDNEKRAELRAKTEQRVKEWERVNAN